MDSRAMVKALTLFAKIWTALAAGVYLLGILSILVNEGLVRLQEIMNPFNVVNYLTALLVFSPAIGAQVLAERIKKKD